MQPIRLFLCGDVMTGRGIDQIMAFPCNPTLHEGYVKSALGYVALAERANSPIPRGVGDAYIWGDALAELERFAPHARVVNLETAVTQSEHWLPKGINYRMNPANIQCLSAAAIDCCVLANNHVLDWGIPGLIETLAAVERIGVRAAGAGTNRSAAQAPAVLSLPGARRLLVFAAAMESSGVPPAWAAGVNHAGVNFLADLSHASIASLERHIRAGRRTGDLVLFSIHWGENWSYTVTTAEARFARALIDSGLVDIVHGHSSHHPKAVEVYRGKLILYGCGDFINDYEGISGHEEFRGDLGLMYLPTLEAESGRLQRLELVATQMKRFQVRRACADDARWLCAVLEREGSRFGTRATLRSDGCIDLRWARA